MQAGNEGKQRTKAAGELGAHLDFVQRLGVVQRLHICVGRPELHALQGSVIGAPLLRAAWSFCARCVFKGDACLACGSDMRRGAGCLGSCICSAIQVQAKDDEHSGRTQTVALKKRITCRPLPIMRLMALLPPPPTPMTLILASPPASMAEAC